MTESLLSVGPEIVGAVLAAAFVVVETVRREAAVALRPARVAKSRAR